LSRQSNQSPKIQAAEKTCIKAMGMLSETGTGGNAAAIDVRNGRIIRIRPLHYDWKYPTGEIYRWKLKARGKVFQPEMKTLLPPHTLGYKKRIFSPNRILYPLKRIDWNPKGERNPQNRGKSKFMRISWDEATDLVASEIKRTHQQYGPYSILCQADGHGETKIVHSAHGCNASLLAYLGGYTLQTRNPDSWEGWYWGAKHVWGMDPVGLEPQENVFADIAENTETLLFWGCDPETTSWGWSGQGVSRQCYWFTELGIKSVYICPDLNYGAAIHADKWIPILPNTDSALSLAIAYVWITEDIYDKDYVVTHTFGFDRFKEYVLGQEDGVPKTPKWAESLTGVPSRIIKSLAREWAHKRTSIIHMMGGGSIRGSYSTERARLEVLLLAMQGIGKPGRHQHLIGMVFWDEPRRGVLRPNPMAAYRGSEIPHDSAQIHGQTMPEFYAQWKQAGWRVPPAFRVTDDEAKIPQLRQIIPKNRIHDAILNPPISWYGTTLWAEPVEDQFQKYSYPVEGCSEIHMIWTDSPCWVTCWNHGNRMIQAFRDPKIEFILAQHPWLENDCLFADIILPVNTKFEEEDINIDGMAEQFDIIFPEEKCIEPIGESRSDYEVVALIAEKLGVLEKYTEGRSVEEWIKFGFEQSGVAQFINYDELKEKKYFIIPDIPEWKRSDKKSKTFMQKFYEDPSANPLKTPSGKIEFYSQNLSRYFPEDKERPPVPHWIPYGESHQESLLHGRSEKYPLLTVSNHGRWRVHANMDDVNWFHEICTGKVRGIDGYLYEPIWINPRDAANRGISSGDVVKIFNERGGVLVGAYVTERIMPGAVYVDHGSRYDPIDPGKLDRGGAINTITPGNTTSRNATGMVCAGFLVQVERVDLGALRKQYPEAFGRPYDNASGLRMDRVLH
jgi:anaerobic selenocysteine-containing dehydrogenase